MQGQLEEQDIKTKIKYQKLNIKNILFDLDGTLTDSKEGITNSYINAIHKMGLAENNREAILAYIGRPLHEYFSERHRIMNIELERAVDLYREYYSVKGIYENKLYEGVNELLKLLHEKNKKIYLVTGKPLAFVHEILKYFNLNNYFVNLFGSQLGVHNFPKDELISQMISNEKPEIKNTVMIGDTKFDILGAKKHGIKSIGVTYGYGSFEEILGSNPDYIVNTVEELTALLV